MLENAQHVEKQPRTAEVQNEQNERKHRTRYGCDPHGRPRKIEMVKETGTACNHGGHAGQSTEEKVQRNFPRPDRWPNDWFSVVTGLGRNWPPGNIDAVACDHAFFPRFFAQFFEALFRWRI